VRREALPHWERQARQGKPEPESHRNYHFLSIVFVSNEHGPVIAKLTRKETNMRGRFVSRHLYWILAMLFVLYAAQIAAAQNNKPADERDTMQSLLNEVRQLRQALETLQRTSIDTYRTQALVDRIRVNREDVRRLTGQLNETRETLARTQRTIPSFIDQQKLMETQLQLEVEPGKRAQLEFELKRSRDVVEMYKSQVESLKEREQQLTNELRIEQSKLNDLETRLDMLDQTIENDRQKLDREKSKSNPQ
jgi:chromosome segregation ATPase